MNRIFETIGRGIARYLDRPAAGYEPFTPTDPAALQAAMRKGDVLLVEGNMITLVESGSAREEIMEIRHSSLFVPRDFDLSPYFAVVKPSLERGFDYRALHWKILGASDRGGATTQPKEAVQ
jgi:hypothetical protein